MTTEHNVLKQLEPLLVDVSTLTLDPTNARTHDRRNLEAIQRSLETFGQHQPIVVQEEGMIVRIGNGRLEAAKGLGWTKIAAVVVKESNVNAIARAIADNKTAELATWDFQILGDLFRGLEADSFDLATTGFADYEIEPLLAAEWKPDASDDNGLELAESEGAKNEEGASATHDLSHTVSFSLEQWEIVLKAIKEIDPTGEDIATSIVELIQQ
jgi:ParB-like chromosome segregation protein Spo0J